MKYVLIFLLKFNNKTILQISIEKALEITSNVRVVLGYKSDELIHDIINFPISIVVNPNYSEGIGSSISYGIKNIPDNPNNILITTCDQPLIPTSHYKELFISSSQNTNSIICSKYQNKFSLPSVFPRGYFKILSNLSADNGADKLLDENSAIFVPLEDEFSIKINTKKDYINLLNKYVKV